MELKAVRLEVPDSGNIIVGQTHFIKTVEDIYEAMVNAVPQMKFGVAFNEASGPCLTRVDGNDDGLKQLATRIYFPDDPANKHDPILKLVPAARRHTLIAARKGKAQLEWNIVLQGKDETVFFDF